MKLQKFIDILDQYGRVAMEFLKKNRKDIFTNDHLLLALMAEKWSKKKHLKLVRLGWIITMDIGSEHFGGKRYFDILPVYKYFADYMNCGCAFFGNKRIPWEEWKDLAKEQVDILKILVEKNQLKSFRRTKIYREFRKKYGDRIDLLKQKGYLSDVDFMSYPSGL